MDTASFHLVWNQDECRAVLRGHVDEPRLNALLGLVAPDQTLCLDLRAAHLSPQALDGLRRVAIAHPLLRLLPESLLELVRTPSGKQQPPMDIVAMLAHELRSPLSLVHTRLQVLAHGLQAEGRDADAESCRRSLRDLTTATRLFELYLTAAQPWQFSPVSVADVAAQSLQALEDFAATSGVAFRLDVQGDTAAHGHPRALHQLLYNLVLNGVQACAPQGEVRVCVRGHRGQVVATVADDGLGFPEMILRQPFVPYRTDRRAGTGLGLVICKWIVDRHQGTLVLANLARGAAVTVTLPASGDASPPRGAVAPGGGDQ